MLKLSVLDQSVAVSGRDQAASIRQTLDLAEKCEAWGYHRFWVSEHHSHPTIVGSAPEVLLAAIAARTTRIRLGSAGVMLPHYSAFKVAEQFRVLDALAPGRIDLGVGRAPGTDARTARVLNPDRNSADRFPQQVVELQDWVKGVAPTDAHPAHGIHAYPSSSTAPVVWMLGSSDYGAYLAAQLGMPYAFAYFITDGQGVEHALRVYRDTFQPKKPGDKPHAAVCVWALAADTEEEAWRLFESRARWRMDRNYGGLAALLPPELAPRDYAPGEQVALAQLRARSIVGTAPQVAQRLRDLADRLQVEELAVITWTHDPAAQARSYELLAQELALSQSSQP